uniref:Uncharacterized protein n=1 Tax=Rhizophora mucronata TaxID=61149 RepID=A0A2P2JAX6_RHIMU
MEEVGGSDDSSFLTLRGVLTKVMVHFFVCSMRCANAKKGKI